MCLVPLVGLLLSVALTGCWDIKAIQDTNYVTAIGFDYEDSQYVVYAQMVDFANVAKQEGGKSGQPSSVWSGHEKGGTVIEAMTKLYQTSQQRMFWGQVSSIVFTDKALGHGIAEYMEGLIRFREMRYTQWVYGTKEPIDRVFLMIPFFNQSPLGSILHQPEENYRQRSYIRPLRLQKIVATYREPGSSAQLPSLGISKDVWKENGKDDPKLMVDGIFVLNKNKPPVWVSDDDLLGLRWLDRDTKRSNVMLSRNGAPAVSIIVDGPKVDVMPETTNTNGKPVYSIRVRAKYYITELLEHIDASQIEKEAVEVVTSEIERTFEYGKKKGLDLYQLDHILYRRKFPLWSKLTRNGEVPLDDYELKFVKVELELLHSGMYKVRDHGKDY
ncbi:Ger(x)C family spore germination protein [Paenibacillus hemerocallicola]|nr:Ger(x)C family spore germination protein [Paenibacillus hemerocallicola]